MATNPEVLVVGGGPAGSISGRVAAEGGTETLLIDKKSDLGQSSTCGGLLSLETWRRLDTSDRAIVNKVKGVVVHPPESESFRLSSSETKAYVVNRDKLNADLLSRAKEGGVKVRSGTGIYGKDGSKVILRSMNGGKEEKLKPEVVIGADGPRSDVRRLFGLERPSELLYAIQKEMKFHPGRSDHVEVFFGRSIAPGFFGWIIPVSKDRARIGLASARGEELLNYFQRLMEKIGVEPPENFRTGVIPIGIPNNPCVDGVLTVGDAAGQVKPTSGGGLFPLSITSRIAGKIALKAVNGLDNPAKLYYEKWMDEIGEDLKREMLLHRVLNRVSDEKLTSLLNLLKRRGISNWIAEHGNIDHLYPLAKRMIRNPSVVGTILKTLPGEIGSKLMDELR